MISGELRGRPETMRRSAKRWRSNCAKAAPRRFWRHWLANEYVAAGRRISCDAANRPGRGVGRDDCRTGEAICCPLLEIGPVDDMGPLQMAAAHLTTYAFVVFISPNAVGYGLSILLAGRGWPEAVKVAAIGPGTVAALAACGVTGTIAPRERFDSEALLALPEFGTAAVAGRRVLLMRGNGGRELLAETLWSEVPLSIA